MSYDNPNAMPDDPSRTADYGYFPWEGEVERPVVSEDEAVDRVIAVLENKEKLAFGRDAECWYEALFEEMCEMHEAIVQEMLIPRFSNSCEINTRLDRAIHKHAENWLAEADYEELEREGFL